MDALYRRPHTTTAYNVASVQPYGRDTPPGFDNTNYWHYTRVAVTRQEKFHDNINTRPVRFRNQ